MSKFSATFAFLLGAAAGGAAVWYYTRDKYAKLAEEEISSVKEAYARWEQRRVKETQRASEPETEHSMPAQPVSATSKVHEKGRITDYAAKYSQAARPVREEEPPKADNPEAPYVISPDEFGELDGYSQVSLTWFEDEVLSDEHGVIIEDVEEIVGDALEHFGEYEDDSVFCRSDPKKCDYEILKDLRTYEEFLKALPPNI